MDYTDLAKRLRSELEEMASRSSVDMELWDRFSNRVLSSADAIEAQAARIDKLGLAAQDAHEVMRNLIGIIPGNDEGAIVATTEAMADIQIGRAHV